MWTKRVLYGLVVLYMTISICQSSYFLARKRSKNHNNFFDYCFCVTNSSFALSWIQEDITEKLDYVSKYIPEQADGERNYDIKDDEITRKYFMKDPWRLQTSMQSNFNHPILDERWEAMNVIKTEYVERSFEKVKYQHFQNIVLKKESFDIPLSIRIEKEGHIFLCDGEYPPISRCYWFMLQSFSGMGSAIRKCEKGHIPSEPGKLPQTSCNDQGVYKIHTIVPTFLSNKMWSHFVLSKHRNVLKFSQFSDQKEKLIMEWKDYDIPIDVTHIIVHSKENSGLWKIHNFEFLYADAASSDVNLGPPIFSTDTFVCISMYVTMCPSCKLVLSLEDGQHVLKTEEFELKHAGWDQIKIMTENANTSNAIRLLVSTKSSDPKPYWAIDKVRLCQRKEFRMLKSRTWASCQLISDSEQVTDVKGQSQPNLNSKCPEDTIGEFCVPCLWMSITCYNLKVCKERKCVCSSGYLGSDCYQFCPRKTYGHGCQKQCTNCKYDCNGVTGTCPGGCRENYYGEKCDIPPATFANPPEITEISYTEATVRVSNFQLENSVSYPIAQYYTVQYKTAEASDINWRNVGDRYHKFNTTGIFKILNLTLGTQYLVQSVIMEPNGKWNINDHLKVNNFATRCDEISEDDINIETSKTTARIYLSEGTTLTCKSHFITLDEEGAAGFSNRSGTFLTNLLPYKSYKVIVRGIQKTYEKKFATDEKAPTVVLSLTGTAASATTVDLKWTEPLSINGVFKHYVVEYQHVSYGGCNFSSVESTTKFRRETENTSITITELIPYSTYEFTVFALNTKFSGPPFSKITTTASSEEIQPEELLNFVGLNTTHDSVNIVLSEIKCENIRGPLTVEIKTTCISEWCQNKHTQRKIDIKTLPKTGIIEVMNLQSYSEYDLEVQLCRVNGNCSAPQKKKFETKTTVSKSVSNLLVYTKNASSVSLRWKPPYPPTGVLKNYKINYFSYRKKVEEEVQIRRCKLWPELHCAILNDLPSNADLTIKVYAINNAVEDYSPPKEIQTYVKTEKSKPPYNLMLNWTTKNDIQVVWKHPNETNGEVSYFGIQVIDSTTDQKEIIDEQKVNVSRETYNLTYHYLFDGSLLSPTTEYTVAVYAFNGEDGDSAQQMTTSPLDVPKLSDDPEFVISNGLLKILVLPNKVRGYTHTYQLLVLRSDKQSNLELYPSLQEYELKNLKVIVECDLSQIPETLEIYVGSLQQQPSCKDKDNSSLKAEITGNITIVLQNFFKNESRTTIYTYNPVEKMKRVVVNPNYYWPPVLLILVLVVIFFVFKWYTKKDVGFSWRNHTSDSRADRQTIELPLVYTKQNRQKCKKSQHIKAVSGNPDHLSKIIGRKNFQNYTKMSLDNHDLKQQHEAILEFICTYETVQVTTDSVEYVDMIYISGLQINKTYAVTKIPTSNEYDAFWETIWTENIRYIVLFENNHTNDRIEQLHFRLESDDGFYLLSLNYVNFFQKMSKIPHSCESPILVHSSSGMRGVGFVLLCDMSLRTATKDGAVDVMANLKNLTQYTSELMVDFDHYVAAHTVIADCLRYIDTTIKCNEFDVNKEKLFDEAEIQEHLYYLQDTEWLDRIKYDDDERFTQAIRPESADELLPAPCTSGDADSFLKRFKIVKVYGFKTQKNFIVLHEPKARPLCDLFNLVQDESVAAIVTLNNEIFLWPNENHPVIEINADVKLEHQMTRNLKSCDWITVKVTTATATQIVEVISLKNWLTPTPSLPKAQNFINFVGESNEICKNVEIVLITDWGNVTTSGLYITLTCIIQKIKTKGVCDICGSVRMLRRHFENFVVNKRHYMFLVEAAHNYLKEFNLYEMR
ncbi:uncharacterized protein LOC135126082 isoform X2 [Zophobas morio]|uniref:uncharacterized protein LOC135126082 isoform X2 n=1 Tax=Zophobas morio TaxID=2755281 RepID=UPI003082B304